MVILCAWSCINIPISIYIPRELILIPICVIADYFFVGGGGVALTSGLKMLF